MSSPPAAIHDPAPPSDETGAVFARQIAMVGQLAEAALRMALAIERQSAAPDTSPEPLKISDNAAMAFARASRAVRLTVMLQARLVQERDAWVRNASPRARALASSAGFERTRLLAQQKGRVKDIVQRIADQEHGEDAEPIGGRVGEAFERLDDEDLHGDILKRPVSELIALICRDLDLTPDWTRVAQEAWARTEMAGDHIGDPLAALAADPPPPPPGKAARTSRGLRAAPYDKPPLHQTPPFPHPPTRSTGPPPDDGAPKPHPPSSS